MDYPESKAFETWADDVASYSVVMRGHFCGYCRFAVKPVKEQGYNGIVAWVPVHGGITYAEQDEHGMVYGFDCAHYNSEREPISSNIELLKNECMKMARWIVAASLREDEFLQADNDRRAAIVDEFRLACSDGSEISEPPPIVVMCAALGGVKSDLDKQEVQS